MSQNKTISDLYNEANEMADELETLLRQLERRTYKRDATMANLAAGRVEQAIHNLEKMRLGDDR